MSAACSHSMVIKNDGSVWATGEPIYEYNVYNTWGKVVSGDVKAVAAGSSFSMVLKQDGSVWAKGANRNGQFGDGSPDRWEQKFVKIIDAPPQQQTGACPHSMRVLTLYLIS